MNWSTIHESYLLDRSVSQIIREKTTYKLPLLEKVMEHQNNGLVLEAGCGTGTSIAFLQAQGIPALGVDSDHRTVLLAKHVIGIPAIVSDIGALPFPADTFDVSFSNGVLEHFSDDRIRVYAREQLRVAQTVIVSIPSRQYRDDQRTYGDERFLTARKWRNILSPVARIVDEFGFHHEPSEWQRLQSQFDIDGYQFLAFVLQR